MSNKDLPAPIDIISPAKATWIINELGRTENKLSVQVKFKKVWGAPLPDPLIDSLIADRQEEIQDLRKAHRDAVDAHEWGCARNRMDEFKKLAGLAISGTCVGIDRQGDPIIKEDLRLALDCIKAAREEQDRENKKDLELLKLMILMGRTGGITNIDGMPGAQGVPSEASTDAEITTDTDKYFD